MAHDHLRNGQDPAGNQTTSGPSANLPGKRTLVEGLVEPGAAAPPVQRKAAGPATEGDVHDGAAAAATGTAMAAGAAAGGAAAPAASTKSLSGAAWCAQYPTGTTIAELTDATFQANVQAFHDAMIAAATPANNLNISISATLRPPQRAHLMHYAFRVHKGTVTPAAANTASEAAGITINWDHGNLATSKAKAGEMVTTYEIAYAPALNSRHTEGKAIDWTITWSGSLMIAKKGETTQLDCTGNGSSSGNLHKVGASYGVHKLVSDPPHWSTDGH